MSAPKKDYRFNDLLNENVDLLAMLADKYADEFATPFKEIKRRAAKSTLAQCIGFNSAFMIRS